MLLLALLVLCPVYSLPVESATPAKFWTANINSVFLGESSWVKSGISEHLAAGAQLALDHCQDQFKWDRWNCPKSAFSRDQDGSTIDSVDSRRGFKPANRETAFVLAVTSAGVVHAVTKSCSTGNLPDCDCRTPSAPSSPPDDSDEDVDERPSDLKTTQLVLTHSNRVPVQRSLPISSAGGNNDVKNPQKTRNSKKWLWSGCSDHVAYGEAVAAKFLDSLVKKGNDAWATTSLHNNHAGRLIVRNTMQKHCKCHGVSGSCSLQTCWMAVNSFSKVAAQLRDRYDHALRIDFEGGRGKLVLGNSASGLMQLSPPSIPSDKLVYLEESPDYCKINNTTGWTGTKGRTCSRNRAEDVAKTERRSCRELCRACGHRVRRKKRQVSRHCQCTFQWCCKVQCQTCVETVTENFCG